MATTLAPMARKPTSMRLDEETLALLAAAAERGGVTQHDIMRQAVRLYCRREGVKLPAKK